jgi:hypothetical protein
MVELSTYRFSTLRKGDLTLYRGVNDASAAILMVGSVGDRDSAASVKRFEHEYALKAELGADWAARPVALAQPLLGSRGDRED